MSYAINTNIGSMNAQRNAGVSQGALSTALERLSSGLRVNSAKDDAAGLAIAERMNAQVRGMNVAVRNANDGISLAQTADGGLASMADMVQRMRELSVQAVNSTNTSSDIGALNEEYTQLRSELSRTLSAVQFNGNSLYTNTANFDFQVGANSGQTITIQASAMAINSATNIIAITTGAVGSALTTSSNSANAANIDLLDKALSTINTTRATLGAVQSRFETTISFLKSSVENQAAARGRIMDADFAQETSNLSRAQILQQAGTAMIAQANQLPQGVLALLR
jgi:flagellin